MPEREDVPEEFDAVEVVGWKERRPSVAAAMLEEYRDRECLQPTRRR